MRTNLLLLSLKFQNLNKYNLFPSKLITVIHHPPFDKILKYAKSDVSIFFTNELKNMASNIVKDRRKIIVNYWYPDNEWYNENKIMVSDEKVYDFLDNGKWDDFLFQFCKF